MGSLSAAPARVAALPRCPDARERVLYWPPLLSAAAFGLAAAAVLVPLNATTYRTALEIESAGAGRGRPVRSGAVAAGVTAPAVLRSTMKDDAER